MEGIVERVDFTNLGTLIHYQIMQQLKFGCFENAVNLSKIIFTSLHFFMYIFNMFSYLSQKSFFHHVNLLMPIFNIIMCNIPAKY